MTSSTTERPSSTPCIGCGGLVPEGDGPTHPYMLASPGCWRLYGEWSATRAFSPTADPIARAHHADCYAVQHHGNADVDRRQRQSVGVHLIVLSLLLDFGETPSRAIDHRSRASAAVLPALGMGDWPHLAAPDRSAGVTIADVAAAAAGDEGRAVWGWAEAAWSIWEEHHETVRGWAQILVAR